jgi:hypothetical protein
MNTALQTELTNQACLPPAGDIRIAAFCQAILNLMDHPVLDRLIDELIQWQADISPSYAVNLLLRAFQRQLMDSDAEPGYPLYYSSEVAWVGALNRLLAEPLRVETIKHDLRYRQVQSNVVERYKAFKLVINLLQPRLGNAPRILDVGCSRNHGLKKLMLNLPFKPIVCGVSDNEKLPSTLLDALFNGVLLQPTSMRQGVGADVVPIMHDDEAVWAKSCSFYPSELLRHETVTEYDYLDHNAISDVTFEVGDFANNGISANLGDDKFDVITVSTFMYQLSATQRMHARTLFKSYLSEQGIIVYQDFVRPDNERQQLEFETNWFASIFPYRTIVEFANSSSGQLYEIFRWSNGRCTSWIPGKDIALVLAEK